VKHSGHFFVRWVFLAVLLPDFCSSEYTIGSS
jgi:hypothetical protein